VKRRRYILFRRADRVLAYRLGLLPLWHTPGYCHHCAYIQGPYYEAPGG
jgi:hypothetical protein